MTDRENELEDLREQVAELQKENEALKAELEELRGDVAQLEMAANR